MTFSESPVYGLEKPKIKISLLALLISRSQKWKNRLVKAARIREEKVAFLGRNGKEIMGDFGKFLGSFFAVK